MGADVRCQARNAQTHARLFKPKARAERTGPNERTRTSLKRDGTAASVGSQLTPLLSLPDQGITLFIFSLEPCRVKLYSHQTSGISSGGSCGAAGTSRGFLKI